MGIRKTGQVIAVNKEVEELICDQCDEVIPDGHYPKFELEVQWRKLRWEDQGGDNSDMLFFCSFECLRDFAVNKTT